MIPFLSSSKRKGNTMQVYDVYISNNTIYSIQRKLLSQLNSNYVWRGREGAMSERSTKEVCAMFYCT